MQLSFKYSEFHVNYFKLLYIYIYSSSLTNACLHCRMLHSENPTVLLARRHLNTMCLTNFENLRSISNIFQETHNFLVLADPVIICVYLRTTDRHFCDEGNVRLPASNLLKYDLVQSLNIFRNPDLWNFAARKAPLVIFVNFLPI